MDATSKATVFPISAHQIKSLQRLTQLERRPEEPVGQLENVNIYDLGDGQFEIELTSESRFIMKDFTTSAMEQYFQHQQKCEQCKVSNCGRFEPPFAPVLASQAGPKETIDHLILNFNDKAYCGLTNKVHKLKYD